MQIRKHLVAFAAMLAALLVFSGCAATVTMSSMVPAQINLSSHRNLAVLSAEPYRFSLFDYPSSLVRDLSGTSPYRIESGFAAYSEREVARYLTERVIRDLQRSDYFTLLLPPASDREGTRPENFRSLGYDALMTIRITDMDIDEYQYAKEESVIIPPADGMGGEPTIVTELRHHVTQKVRYAVEFLIRDTYDGRIIASKSLSGTQEQSYRIEPGSSNSRIATSMRPWFTSLSDSFSREFVDLISPHWVTKTVSLMKNKPEIRSLEVAYEAVKKGNPAVALDLFMHEWNRTKHIPSGYNAAIILDSMGEMERAIDLMRSVWQYSGNNTARMRLYEMERALEAHEKAQRQL